MCAGGNEVKLLQASACVCVCVCVSVYVLFMMKKQF